MLPLVTVIMVLASVGIHFEVLLIATWASRLIPFHRMRVATAIVISMSAHLFEVVLFAFGWKLLLDLGEAELSIAVPDLMDLIYFSGSVYTTIGFGDVVPLGDCRLLAVVEGVVGLVMIAWTASFSVFEMSENWGNNQGSKRA